MSSTFPDHPPTGTARTEAVTNEPRHRGGDLRRRLQHGTEADSGGRDRLRRRARRRAVRVEGVHRGGQPTPARNDLERSRGGCGTTPHERTAPSAHPVTVPVLAHASSWTGLSSPSAMTCSPRSLGRLAGSLTNPGRTASPAIRSSPTTPSVATSRRAHCTCPGRRSKSGLSPRRRSRTRCSPQRASASICPRRSAPQASWKRAFGRPSVTRLHRPEGAPAPTSGRRFLVFPHLVSDFDAETLTKELIKTVGKSIVITPSDREGR